MSRIDEIKARHYAITLTDGREICFQCVDDLRPGLVADWPCDTAHLLAELAAAQAREQALREALALARSALQTANERADGSDSGWFVRDITRIEIQRIDAALAAAGGEDS